MIGVTMQQSTTDKTDNLKIAMNNPHHLVLDLGYRGECELQIYFTDQNGEKHWREFLISVIGEKPTVLSISVVGYKNNKLLYNLSSDDD